MTGNLENYWTCTHQVNSVSELRFVITLLRSGRPGAIGMNSWVNVTSNAYASPVYIATKKSCLARGFLVGETRLQLIQLRSP